MGNVFAVVSTFTSELPIFMKEHHSGMYRSDVYFLCKMLVDLPVFLLIPFVFVTMVYWLAGLYPSAQAYFVACGICALVANVAVSFGYIASCAFATTQLALAVGMTALMPLTLFGGLFLSLRSIPVWLKWIEVSFGMPVRFATNLNHDLGVHSWREDAVRPTGLGLTLRFLSSFFLKIIFWLFLSGKTESPSLLKARYSLWLSVLYWRAERPSLACCGGKHW